MKSISLSLLMALFFVEGIFAQDNIVLYGLRINYSDDASLGFPISVPASVDLQSINPASGEQTSLFTIDGAVSLAAGSSTYNADQDQYFFWGNDSNSTQRIYNLDLESLSVASNPQTADIIVDIEYNYANGKVYGLRLTTGNNSDAGSDPFTPVSNDLDLVEINLETGAVEVVSTLPDTQSTGQGNSTFDPINNRFIFLSFNNGAASVIGIDVTTGETAFDTNLDSVDGQVLAFEYDWANERLLAIRQTSLFDLTNPFFVSIENFLAEIDLETGEVQDISTTPAFADAGIAIGGVAFHQESGTYITYVQGTTLGMISADTGQVFNMVELSELVYEIQVDNHAYAQELNILAAAVLSGDVNQDGAVSFLDIAPFIALLATGGYQIEADINEDSSVNLFDIAPLVDLLFADR